MKTRNQPEASCSSLFETVSQDLDVTDLVRCLASLLSFPNAGLQAGASMPNLFYQFGRSNPDPHACMASVSLNEPILQLKAHSW